jgi:hypothetical protein
LPWSDCCCFLGVRAKANFHRLLAEAAFNGRVRREFPPGTPLNVVQSKLAAEGFTVGRKGAELLRTRVPCQTKWAISWEAASGTITAIDSVYG